jgi:hypothetical protein
MLSIFGFTLMAVGWFYVGRFFGGPPIAVNILKLWLSVITMGIGALLVIYS